MHYVFSSFKEFLIFITIICILTGFGLFNEAPLIAVFVSLIFFVIEFKDYKIIADNEKITFYSIYRRKRYFYWNEIDKFEIEYEIKLGRLGTFQNLNVYTTGTIFTFNINSINKKKFLERLINYCSQHNIQIIDLNTAK
ncbi:MAG: hypothetical protein N4A68_08430 [Maledivibacter sp.]|jgi:hypothetical protein|nr:hypothetical protein [Maledivibacter sp.]